MYTCSGCGKPLVLVIANEIREYYIQQGDRFVLQETTADDMEDFFLCENANCESWGTHIELSAVVGRGFVINRGIDNSIEIIEKGV